MSDLLTMTGEARNRAIAESLIAGAYALNVRTEAAMRRAERRAERAERALRMLATLLPARERAAVMRALRDD